MCDLLAPLMAVMMLIDDNQQVLCLDILEHHLLLMVQGAQQS
jgi:hypothetical protein